MEQTDLVFFKRELRTAFGWLVPSSEVDSLVEAWWERFAEPFEGVSDEEYRVESGFWSDSDADDISPSSRSAVSFPAGLSGRFRLYSIAVRREFLLNNSGGFAIDLVALTSIEAFERIRRVRRWRPSKAHGNACWAHAWLADFRVSEAP